MSNYGPPGGPHPGQPPEPWPDRQPQDPYGQPADPWSGHDPWGGTPASAPPGGPGSPSAYGGYGGYGEPGQPGYGPAPGYQAGPPPGAPGWEPFAPPPRKRGNAPIIAALVTLAVLAGAGGATAFFLLGRHHETTTTQPDSTPTGANPVVPPPASAQPQATTPAPESSTDARFVKAGQCVKNEGDAEKPKLAITTCEPKTYEVLKRIEGTTNGADDAKAKCANVQGYTDWYFFNSELDGLDFVLCLKLR
jgi:hypothetical protein